MASPEHASGRSRIESPPAQARGWLTRWMRQPQGTWLRKAMFQVHLWSGMLLGLYVVVVCASGSALVFRNDIYSVFEDWIRAGKVSPNDAWLKACYVMFRWLGDLHGRLLLGAASGMMINAVGGFLTAAICVTGLVIWWPGISRWRRALIVTGGVGWKRLNFDLHSAVGFWTFALLFMWGMTGGYFVFPQPFRAVINYFTPIDAPLAPQQRVIVGGANPRVASTVPGPAAPVQAAPPQAETARQAGSQTAVSPKAVTAPQTEAAIKTGAATPTPGPFPRRRRRPLTKGGKILQWFSFLHYGNFAGWPLKALWLLLGLAPAVLFGTAVVMWWNRVLSPALRRWRAFTAPSGGAVPELELERD